MNRRRLLIGVACVATMPLVSGNALAVTVAQAEQYLRERESALRVAKRRHAAGKIPYKNVQARQNEVDEAKRMLNRVRGGGGGSSNRNSSVSTNQSAPSGNTAQLEQYLREREAALRVAKERYAQGKIPYANVLARQREVDEAKAALGRGGQSSGQSASPEPSPSSSGTARNAVYVSNASQLASACRNAAPGMRIVLANGSYSQNGGFAIKANGNSSSPIMVEAATRGRATLNSAMTIYGNHVHVQGLTLAKATLEFFGQNCSVKRCTFVDSKTAISARGANNIEIAYNDIRGWSFWGIALDPIYGGQSGHNPYVHHNYLGNGRNSGDFAIGVGRQPSHTDRQVNARIEYNLIENCNFDQMIMLKCSKNTVRYNTLQNCGAIYVRHGKNNMISNNFTQSTKGIWLCDIGNEARDNRLQDSHILVLGGDLQSRQLQGQSGGFPRAENTRLTNNFADRTEIGRVFSRSGKRLPAIGTVVNGHKGRIYRGTEQNTRISNANSSSAGNRARRLSKHQVGPNA